MLQPQRDRFERWLSLQFSCLARKRIAVAFLLAAISISGRVALLPWIPIPKAAIQDEFSYLLAADTYASGRLTNPQHPMWVHFETVHEMVRPTYQSKYGPLQGLLLALGQVLGEPWIGVLITMGMLNAAIWWALSGWLPPRWALLGSLLALLRVGFINYWSESYWGGAAAAAAGALVIGAVPRLRRRVAMRPALIFAGGLALLANSRPYEGLVLGVICLGAILIKIRLRAIIGPLALVLVPVGLWMGYYNYRVTGDALLLPYQAHERQYVTWSPFIWSTHPRQPPHYNHEDLRATWIEWEERNWTYQRAHPFEVRLRNLFRLQEFYLGIPLTLCIIVFLARIFHRQAKMRTAITLSVLFLIGAEMETMLWPHYVAPGMALAFILAVASLRCLRRVWIAGFNVLLFMIVLLDLLQLTLPGNRWLFDKREFIAERSSVLRKLEQAPGKQLVLVEYGSGHDVNHEWVYNKADIDNSQIVWAHAMDPKKDLELLQYFRDRNVWRLVDKGIGHVDLSEERHGK